MAKVLLVEDDNNLREIYEARLQAEGYDIVSAADGEEALVVAKREMPDLVISDVMMPKISGFEMLDILRNTDGLKDVQVIMLTALGQAEDKTRADQLGANKYLVKSQVTLEDIVKTTHQLLDDETMAPTPAAPAPVITPAPAAPVAPPAPVAAMPVVQPPAAPQPVAVAPVPPVPEQLPTAPVVTHFSEPAVTPVAPAPAPAPVAQPAPAPIATPQPATPSAPPSTPTQSASPATTEVNNAETTAQETADMQAQIESFVQSVPTAPLAVDPTPATPAPVATVVPPTANDTVMNNAVESLVADTQSHAKTTDVTAVEVEPPENSPLPDAGLAAAVTSKPDNAEIAGKKIIKPLSDPTTKSSLNDLLAKEEANAAASAPSAGTVSPTVMPQMQTAPQMSLPTAPTTPPVSTPVQPAPGDENDPNAIAL